MREGQTRFVYRSTNGGRPIMSVRVLDNRPLDSRRRFQGVFRNTWLYWIGVLAVLLVTVIMRFTKH